MRRSAIHTLAFAAKVRKLVQARANESGGPWFNSADGAMYLRQPSRDAFRLWARRHGVVPLKRAGLVLYAKADVDRVLGISPRRRRPGGSATAEP